MKYFRQWCIIILAVFIAEISFDSCSPHYRYKSVMKRRRAAASTKYHSTYLKKLRKNVIPINKNYIIKNVRNRTGAPNSKGKGYRH